MITYKAGYKYQLYRSINRRVPFTISKQKTSAGGLLRLSANGILTIKHGYAWDGASFPAIDTKNFMRGSLFHDALYQLIREGVLHKDCREEADKVLREICLQDGMSRLRAWWVFKGVRFGGASAASTSSLKEIKIAP